MSNSDAYLSRDINALRTEMLELTKRIVVAETQLDELVREYKFKKQVWAMVRRELGKLGWVIACAVLALIMIKLHIFG